mmetsp:Transcript_28873/g.73693  ORF Transcript_28873/g.73693 Transcript_28873/m.73693 type:complete len:572 (-) Transcript_28873:367-2082(-)|eukprot:CAMPEP_0202869128 /NCGR_PEP_ID=MMETSP1391-20130828/11932_1 /ASSEMBLY_ACC=CAM_ASM_000867 /TAXON_ID=1034604 /ORGANISM="Chlamydomonas leiostraca, Strain SAG 11-49" /LENGTH=571 /DNA_ID=CAMNT_0049549393 /DNA_START=174 /DNA_END=1889 /DNA_ORIENTATION=-
MPKVEPLNPKGAQAWLHKKPGDPGTPAAAAGGQSKDLEPNHCCLCHKSCDEGDTLVRMVCNSRMCAETQLHHDCIQGYLKKLGFQVQKRNGFACPMPNCNGRVDRWSIIKATLSSAAPAPGAAAAPASPAAHAARAPQQQQAARKQAAPALSAAPKASLSKPRSVNLPPAPAPLPVPAAPGAAPKKVSGPMGIPGAELLDEPKRKARKKTAKPGAGAADASGSPARMLPAAGGSDAAATGAGTSAGWDEAGRAVLQHTGMTLDQYLRLAGGQCSDDEDGYDRDGEEEEEEEEQEEQSEEQGGEAGAAATYQEQQDGARVAAVAQDASRVNAGVSEVAVTKVTAPHTFSPTSPLSPSHLSPINLTPAGSDSVAAWAAGGGGNEVARVTGVTAAPPAAVTARLAVTVTATMGQAPAMASYMPHMKTYVAPVGGGGGVAAASAGGGGYNPLAVAAAAATVTAAPAAVTPTPVTAAHAYQMPAMHFLQQLSQARQQHQLQTAAVGAAVHTAVPAPVSLLPTAGAVPPLWQLAAAKAGAVAAPVGVAQAGGGSVAEGGGAADAGEVDDLLALCLGE